MRRKSSEHGLSILEALIVLSIIATLASLAMPSITAARSRIYVTQCHAQMQSLGLAVNQYRQEHQGRTPSIWGDLVPKYANQESIICPFTRAMAPEIVRRWITGNVGRSHPRAGYFLFSYKALNKLKESGESPLSYSDIMRMRGVDTPVIICRDHREPFSITWGDRRPEYANWAFPEQPVIVVRINGSVDLQKKGGMWTRLPELSTMLDALML